MERVFAFVDGGHLRAAAKAQDRLLPDPALLVRRIIVDLKHTSHIRSTTNDYEDYDLRRTLYFDAEPENQSETPGSLFSYWDALEVTPDTEVGWGVVRGRRNRRQKRVDTLLSVAMLVGAYQKLFDTVILVAADEDFVPAVDEVRRLGVRVVLAPIESDGAGISGVLRRSVDRVISWDPGRGWPQLVGPKGEEFESF